LSCSGVVEDGIRESPTNSHFQLLITQLVHRHADTLLYGNIPSPCKIGGSLHGGLNSIAASPSPGRPLSWAMACRFMSQTRRQNRCRWNHAQTALRRYWEGVTQPLVRNKVASHSLPLPLPLPCPSPSPWQVGGVLLPRREAGQSQWMGQTLSDLRGPRSIGPAKWQQGDAASRSRVQAGPAGSVGSVLPLRADLAIPSPSPFSTMSPSPSACAPDRPGSEKSRGRQVPAPNSTRQCIPRRTCPASPPSMGTRGQRRGCSGLLDSHSCLVSPQSLTAGVRFASGA
jgi:hypothetical protein